MNTEDLRKLDEKIYVSVPSESGNNITISGEGWSLYGKDAMEWIEKVRERGVPEVDRMDVVSIRKDIVKLTEQVNFLTEVVKELREFYTKLTD